MVKDNNGPKNPYPGPAKPGSDQEVYPDISDEHGSGGGRDQKGAVDDSDMPKNPPVDEAEEPSPGSSA
ncbi:hypothetical protein [Pseudomonas capeferrum]|uniref:hypothetical protein n=1 Tax=Pseudomonas capeferrum TaxID=1495066 RepID=UPI0015E27019|nr:hypothetical protein [Pseudomonas capeferrum]